MKIYEIDVTLYILWNFTGTPIVKFKNIKIKYLKNDHVPIFQ
jgi:hypothetical protein